jgi:hypothetical protein
MKICFHLTSTLAEYFTQTLHFLVISLPLFLYAFQYLPHLVYVKHFHKLLVGKCFKSLCTFLLLCCNFVQIRLGLFVRLFGLMGFLATLSFLILIFQSRVFLLSLFGILVLCFLMIELRFVILCLDWFEIGPDFSLNFCRKIVCGFFELVSLI